MIRNDFASNNAVVSDPPPDDTASEGIAPLEDCFTACTLDGIRND